MEEPLLVQMIFNAIVISLRLHYQYQTDKLQTIPVTHHITELYAIPY